MGIIIGSARIGENGHATGGLPGDQTGSEVSTQPFYMHSKGWWCLRAKSVAQANALATAMKQACDNNHIGYNQDSRDGCFSMLKKYGSLAAIKESCNTDCSALVRCCILQACGVDLGDMYTGNMADIIEHSPLFKDRFNVTSESQLYDGDILITKSKGHTAICVSGRKREEPAVSYNSFMEAVEGTAAKARREGWRYGDSKGLPPCSDGVISCDRLAARALWDYSGKCRDQPKGGFTTYNMEPYLLGKGWSKNTNINAIKNNDIVFMKKKGTSSADWQWHVFICKTFRNANDIDKYDAGNQSRINVGCFFGHVPVNEWGDKEFYCSFSEISDKPLPDSWEEIKGADRYETGIKAMALSFCRPDSIVLASGEAFPDALAAYSYAGIKKCPVMITKNNELSSYDISFLKLWNSVKSVTVIGKALKGSCVGKLIDLGVERINVIGGADRYETAEAVCEAVINIEHGDSVCICDGNTFADAASMSPWLYSKHMPVLLASNEKLTERSKKLLSKFSNIYVIGKDVEGIEQDYIFISGDDRYETSRLIAEHFCDKPNEIFCVSGKDSAFADAISCGASAGMDKSPIILVEGNLDYISNNNDKGYIVGAAASGDLRNKIAEVL